MQEIRIQALGMRVKCLLAVCERSALDSFLLSAPGVGIPDTAMRSLLAPPELSSMEVGKSNALVAIGTLDIQVRHQTIVFLLVSLSSVQWKLGSQML